MLPCCNYNVCSFFFTHDIKAAAGGSVRPFSSASFLCLWLVFVSDFCVPFLCSILTLHSYVAFFNVSCLCRVFYVMLHVHATCVCYMFMLPGTCFHVFIFVLHFCVLFLDVSCPVLRFCGEKARSWVCACTVVFVHPSPCSVGKGG